MKSSTTHSLFLGLFIVVIGCFIAPFFAYAVDDDNGNYEGFEASPEAYNLLPNGQDPPSASSAGKPPQFDPYAGPRGYVPIPKTAPAKPKKRGFFSAGKLDPPPKPPAKEPPSLPREFPASVEPLCRLGVSLQGGDLADEVLKPGVYRVFTYGAVIHPQTNQIVGLPSRLELWEHGKKRLSVSLTLMPWQAEPVTALPPPPADAPKEGMLNQGPYRRLVVVMGTTGETLKLQYQLGDFHMESPPLTILPVGESL
jgi:hypothetical protein